VDVVITGDLQQVPDVLFQQGAIAHGGGCPRNE
jgi:hypothetical protein